MKAVSIIAVLLLLAANAAALLLTLNVVSLPPSLATAAASPGVLALPPALAPILLGVQIATLAFGLIALIAGASISSTPRNATPPVALAAQPVTVPVTAPRAEAEVVSLLATLQAKGRLVDFLMDDINAYNDAQVGAAARVVHAGCKAVLAEHFQIHPVREEKEQSQVVVPADYPADEYRLLGKISGQAPFAGTLVHHGWKTDFVKLPTILRGSADRLPAIAPAEVELK